MTKFRALSQIEGLTADHIAPGSVFSTDEQTAKRLLGLNAIREASKEDVAMAKVKGLLIEDQATDQATEPTKAKATKTGKVTDTTSPAPASTGTTGKANETTTASKADDVL